ncbi:MAG: competence/damage-inducible protein A [Sedimentisphaerales bacterium]|nr:competence/damage-inducible protein A [Sedimentisphaerales bacterium]
MKQASIVTIGNEILAGLTVDTNAAFLAIELQNIGIPVVSSYTVGDEIDAIVQKLNLASSDADVIVVTGGLGPTDDDITRQAFAKFLGVELELREEIFQRLIDFFKSRNIPMPEKNKVQAYIPSGAEYIPNVGTAPGIIARNEGKMLIALPGVPWEADKMFKFVIPELKEFAGTQAIEVCRLKCFGLGESVIAEMLGDKMLRGRNPLVNCTVHDGIITLHIVASAENSEKAIQKCREEEKKLREVLGDLVYGSGDETLAEAVSKKLALQGKTIATAESCTGGLLSKMLTDISGSSNYFNYGWITYSNKAKITQLDVPADLIEQYGAVSEQVAKEMAQGARKKSGADFAIAITGIAGPTGGSEQKPVGLVYICVDYDGGCDVKQCFFTFGREFTRLRAAHTALNMLRQRLG